MTADINTWTNEQHCVREETSLEKEKQDRQQTNVKHTTRKWDGQSMDFRWNMWAISLSMEYIGIPYNTECEFLFLAGLIIGRISFLSSEALLFHKIFIFKESK